MPQYFTVGHLIARLRDLDPSLRLRLAVSPDFPFAHYVGTDVIVHDGIAYLGEDGQEGYLPPAVRDQLAWA
ncbi:hypothetical protein ACFVVU_22345 [Kitasatospora sp. NPDC057965]|uniref:hypothetical protein n=1 Tax=Kitasatospora sp. NPDC057965 TaxID=3346291 RepID=UPI0036DC3C13